MLPVMTETSRRNDRFWAGMAGIASGLMFYEYLRFVMLVPLPIAYWFLRGVVSGFASERRRIVSRSVWFIVAFSVVTPFLLLDQVIYDPIVTHQGDITMRHRVVERIQDDIGAEYFGQWLGDARDDITRYLDRKTIDHRRCFEIVLTTSYLT